MLTRINPSDRKSVTIVATDDISGGCSRTPDRHFRDKVSNRNPTPFVWQRSSTKRICPNQVTLDFNFTRWRSTVGCNTNPMKTVSGQDISLNLITGAIIVGSKAMP